MNIFCLRFAKVSLFAVCEDFSFCVCAITFCLQCAGFILFAEWDCILCQDLEFILFAVHLILRYEQLFVICG